MMTFKRFMAVALALLLLVGALPELTSALAEVSEAWIKLETVAPTCTEKGYEIWSNFISQQTEQRNYTPALGHDWGAWKTVTEASCTKEGLKARSCNRCGVRETEKIGGAHQYGPWETDIPGTCMTKERAVRKCKLCGYLDYWYKDYGDHDWGEWETVKAPTATEPGEERRVCKNTPNHVETREIPATGGKLHPALYLKVSWDKNAGEGKRYEGAKVPLYYTVTNTGDCTVYVDSREYSDSFFFGLTLPNGMAYVPEFGVSMGAVKPGESWSYDSLYPVSADEVKIGSIDYDTEGVVVDSAQYITADGKTDFVGSNNGVIHIPLTYPDGDEPEGEKPGLTLAWTAAEPSEPLAPDAPFDVLYSVTNSGNVTMDVVQHTEYVNLNSFSRSKTSKGDYEKFASLIPGKTLERDDGYAPISERITPDTETEDLLGTVNIRIWYTGHDPETGEELCTSNTLTRTWTVAKDDGPHPALYIEITWDDNAGEGKRYEGAIIPLYCKVTNTGDCPVYKDPSYKDFIVEVTDIAFPNGAAYNETIGRSVVTVNPGQSWSFTWQRPVFQFEVEKGLMHTTTNAWAYSWT